VSETADTAANTGRYNSRAIDSNDNIHISYYDYDNSALKYATNSSGSWETETIDNNAQDGLFCSIAIDSKDNVHIVYRSRFDTTDYLKYATNVSGDWDISSIVANNGLINAYSASMALDSLDNVHVSDLGGEYVGYTNNISGSWSRVGVAVGANYNDVTSIAIDSSATVHIVYIDSQELIIASYISDSWQFETADMMDWVGSYEPSLAIDSLDKLHVSYREYTPYRENSPYLKYVSNSGGAWEGFYIDVSGETGFKSSIAVDSAGKVHISYIDATNGLLKYTTNKS